MVTAATTLLELVGLGAIVYAAYLFAGLPLGVLVFGIVLLVIAWRVA